MPHDWLTPWEERRDQDGDRVWTRVWNLKNGKPDAPPDECVQIQRPSKWGNPFRRADGYTRDEAVDRFLAWVVLQDELMKSLHELRGKVLICGCKPLRCHGDVLAALADAPPPWVLLRSGLAVPRAA